MLERQVQSKRIARDVKVHAAQRPAGRLTLCYELFFPLVSQDVGLHRLVV